jgi:hypothetical protein
MEKTKTVATEKTKTAIEAVNTDKTSIPEKITALTPTSCRPLQDPMVKLWQLW